MFYSVGQVSSPGQMKRGTNSPMTCQQKRSSTGRRDRVMSPYAALRRWLQKGIPSVSAEASSRSNNGVSHHTLVPFRRDGTTKIHALQQRINRRLWAYSARHRRGFFCRVSFLFRISDSHVPPLRLSTLIFCIMRMYSVCFIVFASLCFKARSQTFCTIYIGPPGKRINRYPFDSIIYLVLIDTSRSVK